MARLDSITEKNQVPAEKHDIFDSIVGSRGRVSGPFSMLLHSPEVAGRAAHLGAYIRFESVLPADHRELAILTAAREFDFALGAPLQFPQDGSSQLGLADISPARGQQQ